MKFQPFSFALLLLLTMPSIEAAPKPDPSIVVEGVLQVGEFIGPPNYGENPESDRIEQSYYLQLPATLVEQLHGNSSLSAFTPEARATYFVQLAVSDSAQTNASKLIGQKVKAVGILSGAATGHDRTPILVEARSLSKITRWKW